MDSLFYHTDIILIAKSIAKLDFIKIDSVRVTTLSALQSDMR